MPVRKIAAIVATTITALLAICSTAAAVPTVDGHFPTPDFDGSNAKIAAGPDGNMWLTVNEGEFDVARIGPDGSVTPFKLGPEIENALGIAAGPDGRMWVTATNKIGSFAPGDPEGTIDVDPVASITSNSPIVAGPDGQMWAAASNAIVHFSPSAPDKAEAFSVPELQPKDIDVAGSGLVVADSGNKRIVTMTTAGVPTDISLLGETTTAQGVAGGAGGQMAFSKSDQDEGLGLVTPPALPTATLMEGDPFGVALGSDGAFWFAMSAANNLQRLTPDGKAAPLNGFPPEFFPRQIAPGPSNRLWVTMEIPGKAGEYEVARISGLEPPVKPGNGIVTKALIPSPETKIDKGPKKTVKTKRKRASVKFRFSSTSPGVTFECAVVKKPKKGKRTPQPKFMSCKSPMKLKLRPGRYVFSVRALEGGIPDLTPATSNFRVVRVK